MAKTCVICRKPSGMYPLCVEHLRAKNEGTVVKCEECKTWHYTDKPCKCEHHSAHASEPSDEKKTTSKQPTSIAINGGGACLTCGNSTDGKLFCKSCYFKFKNKTLLIKITNCETYELLDESYEGIYVCRDGHIVKSKSERDIDNYLFDNGYKHAYEKELRTDDGTPIHPDFYLPDLNAYLEHWGYDESNKAYTEIKKKKMEYYRSHGITLICTYEKTDARDIDSALNYKLHSYKEHQINFEE